MREAVVVTKIKQWLSERGAVVFKYHGSVYGIKGHADLYGVLPGGRAFFIEVKRPGQKPKPWQAAFLLLVKRCGAVAGWCDSVQGAKKMLSIHMDTE